MSRTFPSFVSASAAVSILSSEGGPSFLLLIYVSIDRAGDADLDIFFFDMILLMSCAPLTASGSRWLPSALPPVLARFLAESADSGSRKASKDFSASFLIGI